MLKPVQAIVTKLDAVGFDFDATVRQLSLEDIPVLVNELARIARARASNYQTVRTEFMARAGAA